MRRLVIEVSDELEAKLHEIRATIELRGRTKPNEAERTALSNASTMRALLTAFIDDELAMRSIDEIEMMVLRRPVKKGPPIGRETESNGRVRLTDEQRMIILKRKSTKMPVGTRLYLVDAPWFEDEVDGFLGTTPTLQPTPIKKRQKRIPR